MEGNSCAIAYLFSFVRPFNPRFARGDTGVPVRTDSVVMFQSTPPRGDGVQLCVFHDSFSPVSIHAPREGRHSLKTSSSVNAISFNPRPREGGDDTTLTTSAQVLAFQSTPPRRGRPNVIASFRAVSQLANYCSPTSSAHHQIHRTLQPGLKLFGHHRRNVVLIPGGARLLQFAQVFALGCHGVEEEKVRAGA